MDHEKWMRRCLHLAEKARGHTSPNPMVGAVLVDEDGQLMAEAWHQAAGAQHAERAVCNQVSTDLSKATLYVNLEPCCVWGKTPPCSDLLIERGVSRVVVGMLDPDPRMCGKGIEDLIAAGISVTTGVLEAECKELNRVHIHRCRHQRPFVTVKTATSLDARIASAHGQSQWITGLEARREGHRLRAEVDAIVMGTGTLFADNPALTTRHVEGPNPIAVLLDSQLRCPADAKFLQADREAIIFCCDDAPDRVIPGASIIRVSRKSGFLQLNEVVEQLYRRQIYHVLIEGGATVYSRFLAADLIDEIMMFMAPMVLAGGPNWCDSINFQLAHAPRYAIKQTRLLGNKDLMIQLRKENNV